MELIGCVIRVVEVPVDMSEAKDALVVAFNFHLSRLPAFDNGSELELNGFIQWSATLDSCTVFTKSLHKNYILSSLVQPFTASMRLDIDPRGHRFHVQRSVQASVKDVVCRMSNTDVLFVARLGTSYAMFVDQLSLADSAAVHKPPVDTVMDAAVTAGKSSSEGKSKSAASTPTPASRSQLEKPKSGSKAKKGKDEEDSTLVALQRQGEGTSFKVVVTIAQARLMLSKSLLFLYKLPCSQLLMAS